MVSRPKASHYQKFHEISSITLSNPAHGQTNPQTNKGKNITSLAEITYREPSTVQNTSYKIHGWLSLAGGTVPTARLSQPCILYDVFCTVLGSRYVISAKEVWLVPSTRRSTLGDRAFPVASARAWNSLPSSVRNAPSLTTFRRELKTVPVRSSFDND